MSYLIEFLSLRFSFRPNDFQIKYQVGSCVRMAATRKPAGYVDRHEPEVNCAHYTIFVFGIQYCEFEY